jgi:hypothetical protein
MPPAILAIVLVLGLLALIPTRRLARLGWSTNTIGGYFLVLWVLGCIAALAPGGGRLLVPVVLIVWIAPFVTWREGLDRLRGRPRDDPGRPPRNVTPPDEPR